MGAWREKEQILRGREKALGEVGDFKWMEAARMQVDTDHCVGKRESEARETTEALTEAPLDQLLFVTAVGRNNSHCLSEGISST